MWLLSLSLFQLCLRALGLFCIAIVFGSTMALLRFFDEYAAELTEDHRANVLKFLKEKDVEHYFLIKNGLMFLLLLVANNYLRMSERLEDDEEESELHRIGYIIALLLGTSVLLAVQCFNLVAHFTMNQFILKC